MERMGTIEQLNDEELKNLEFQVHHFNKLNYTNSSTSNSTPLEFYVIQHPKCQIQVEFSQLYPKQLEG